MSTTKSSKSLQLVFPQWEGGNNPPYHFGGLMLGWLAEGAIPCDKRVTVPVRHPKDSKPLKIEGTITGKSAVMENLKNALDILKKEEPDRVVTLGGDCGVSLAPFSYLSSRYKDETFGLLWLDAHPDITSTQEEFPNAHMHVLANLMGHGRQALTSVVHNPVPPAKVMIAGVHSVQPHEDQFLKEKGVNIVSPEDAMRDGPRRIAEWIKREGITRLAVHLDLDVLDPADMSSVVFQMPNPPKGYLEGVPEGKLKVEHLTAIMKAVSASTDVVGFTIAEFFPWDAMRMRDFMKGLSLNGPKHSSKL